MLAIKVNNIQILPMRPDAPEKTFGSSDVPHGTQSVVYKAIKVYNSNGGNVPLPTFSEEEVSALIAEQEAKITVLERDIVDERDNVTGQNEITDEYLQMFKPTAAEIEAEYYDISTNEMGEVTKTPKKAVSNDPMMMDGDAADLYADFAAAEVALTARLKTELAKRYIDKAIDECLLVPELSEDFMAQFELIEVEPV